MAGALLAALAGGAHSADHPVPAHHRPIGFQNNHMEFQPRGLLTWLSWQISSACKRAGRAPSGAVPVVAPNLAFIQTNAKAGPAMQPAVTWVGHATVLVQVGGLNILTDPMFSKRASPFTWLGPQRQTAPGLAVPELPHIDVVLVSHNHYDHLDEASLQALQDQPDGAPLLVVPLGHRPWLTSRGIQHFVELDWWQSHSIGDVDIMLTPTQHWSARGLQDTMHGLWGGYAVMAPDFHLFFAGDTAYSPDFADLRQRLLGRQGHAGFDLALLPIGVYEPRWFMADQHVNPDEAVQIHQDLQAKRSIGVHWGTFQLSDEALDEPPQALARAVAARGLAPEVFTVLAVGQTRVLPKRGQAAEDAEDAKARPQHTARLPSPTALRRSF